MLFIQIEGLGMGLQLVQHSPAFLVGQAYFYQRYVDDTFLLFKPQSHVSLSLDYLSS